MQGASGATGESGSVEEDARTVDDARLGLAVGIDLDHPVGASRGTQLPLG